MVEVTETGRGRRRSKGASSRATARRIPASKGDGKRQQLIDETLGFGGKRIPELDAIGERIVEAADQRAIWLSKLRDAKESGIDTMLKMKVDEYIFSVDTRTFRMVLEKETKLSTKKMRIEPVEN